mmetsp:Transcript_66254/g.149578  ORF Transcript_66254/g.149578 Transcript_66254/m.149578 type:complete len:323 (+) Transcript_66254:98-1066(+)
MWCRRPCWLLLALSTQSGALSPSPNRVWFSPSEVRASPGFAAACAKVEANHELAYASTANSRIKAWADPGETDGTKSSSSISAHSSLGPIPVEAVGAFSDCAFPCPPPPQFGDRELCFLTKAPIFSSGECAAVVAEAEARPERWSAQSQFYYARDVTQQVEDLPKTREWFGPACRDKLFPLLEECFPGAVNKANKANAGGDGGAKNLRIFDAKVLKYNATAGQAFLGVHRDGSLLTAILALNSDAEYEGGGTYLEPLGKAVRYSTGHVCCHAGAVRHGGQRIESGVRYALVCFVDLYGDQSSASLLVSCRGNRQPLKEQTLK